MARIGVVVLLLAVGATLGATLLAHRSEAAPAAAIQRTFVSTAGSDANPCTRTAPCRNFAAAMANTLAGGEVVALDSGGYGPFTVDKSLSVIGAPGAHAAVTAFSGDGITVDAGATDVVVLRNLHVTGLGGDNGIRVIEAAAVHVESVTVSGFTNRGLRATAAELPMTLIVRDSSFRHNNGGVVANGTGGQLRVQIERTRADLNSLHGFWFVGPAQGSVQGSTAEGNEVMGFRLEENSRVAISDSRSDGNQFGVGTVAMIPGAMLDLDRVVPTNNTGDGVFAGAGSVVRVSGSTITGNNVGLHNGAGTVESYGDNMVPGNTTATSGVIPTVAKT